MKKLFKEFKAFVSRGNVVDMAVGVIIASAFSKIVTTLTDQIIMPIINLMLSAGGKNGLEEAYTFLRKAYDAEGNLDLSTSIYIDWGAFLTAIINFFLIALTLFIVLKLATRTNKVLKEVVDETTDIDLIKEKIEISKKAKAEHKRFRTLWKAHLLEKQKQKEQEQAQKALEEEKRKAEERKLNPTDVDLLKEIRDLLAEQNNKQ